MHDDLERSLQQYRPVGPPTALRERILAQATGRSAVAFTLHTVIEWLPAAAALGLALMFYGLATLEQLKLSARMPVIPPIEQPVVQWEEPPQ